MNPYCSGGISQRTIPVLSFRAVYCVNRGIAASTVQRLQLSRLADRVVWAVIFIAGGEVKVAALANELTRSGVVRAPAWRPQQSSLTGPNSASDDAG